MNLAGKKVLVTGAGGFIGSHLVEALANLGCDTRAFVHYSALNSWGCLDTFPMERLRELDVYAGDIRDPNDVLEAVQGCEVVFHLAALVAIPLSYRSPDSYVETNIRGTLNVLQAVRKLGVARVMITSTSEVYGTARYAPVDERHPLQGQSPYSATKIGADRLAESFHRSFGAPVVIARPFNTYGPRQSARAMIPAAITQLLAGEAELHMGNLAPTRDFNYVTDTVEGLIALAEADSAVGREVNIATGQEHSIAEVVDVLVSELNPNARIVTDEQRLRPDASEVFRLVGDNALITTLTGWRPRHDLSTGLADTIAWFRQPNNLARYKPWLNNV
jgi:NAD dependent epimerase/dehydratase